ncbi:MAG: 2-isopropylmalate synthase [Aquabacterium sp.]|uniref:2-isopropylmalate synthase n=1 Tax=Aquabacterium sp. TaxID=1872578 RepID=UPI003BD26F8D
MLKQPTPKYQAFQPVRIQDRQWPNKIIDKAPIWMSTDLRDGNQALFEPMSVDKKMRMFKTLCDIGFKEIEVGFPSASQTEFDFVRKLIDENHIPEGVHIEVLVQAREHLIRRTFESLKGARSAIVHFYTATNDHFREVVFGMNREEVTQMAVDAVALIKQLAAEMPETQIMLEYSPEHFSSTDLDFARDICDAVTAAWGATPERKVILNLPATVEVATPNVYADQIEWMHRHLARRDSVILSLHPHNDRGTAVAAAELGLLAGADRVEGCLFGNGERTGNVDLVTVALNLYTQGVDPELDFSSINDIARTYEYCTQLPVHPRHPYVGDLVFTAFSGSHQDAIKKGFATQKVEETWTVPYLPIDPADVGRTYDSIIRINSQSGKGGVAYLLESEHQIVMPRRMQVEFSGVVQRHADAVGTEIDAKTIWDLFSQTYIEAQSPITYVNHRLSEHGTQQAIELDLDVHGVRHRLHGEGNGPIDAAVNAVRRLGIDVQVRSYEERSVGEGAAGSHAQACAFVEVADTHRHTERFGVGLDGNIVTAALKATVSALNRLGVKAGQTDQAQAA